MARIERRDFVKDYVLDLKKKDGTIISVLLTASVRKDKKGGILGYQGIIRDNTEQKRMENRLRKAHEENEHLIRAVPSILIGISPDLYITKWNIPPERTFGISSALESQLAQAQKLESII